MSFLENLTPGDSDRDHCPDQFGCSQTWSNSLQACMFLMVFYITNIRSWGCRAHPQISPTTYICLRTCHSKSFKVLHQRPTNHFTNWMLDFGGHMAFHFLRDVCTLGFGICKFRPCYIHFLIIAFCILGTTNTSQSSRWKRRTNVLLIHSSATSVSDKDLPENGMRKLWSCPWCEVT